MKKTKSSAKGRNASISKKAVVKKTAKKTTVKVVTPDTSKSNFFQVMLWATIILASIIIIASKL